MNQLPPGQRAISFFPRFGLPQYAPRTVSADHELRIEIGGDVATEGLITAGLITAETLAELPRVDQLSDFHCVTTWSTQDNRWGGYRFADLYEQIVKPLASADAKVQHVLFRCLDGYRTTMLLADLLADDVMLADSLGANPLGSDHGAPMRLVAPKHYGYKNPKHLKRIEFWGEPPQQRSSRLQFIDHPRARVAFEERGQIFPGWFLRYLYRPLIGPAIRRFEQAEGDGRYSSGGGVDAG